MIITVISLVALALGSYTDMKTREIPDTLSIGMIFLGLCIGIGNSILLSSFKPIISALLGLAAGAIIGLASYYTGQWGGGDAKVLMGLGSLIGLNVFAANENLPQFALLLINLVLVGAAYGIIYLIALALRNWKTFRPEFRLQRRSVKILRVRRIMLSAIFLFTVIALLLKMNFELMAGIYIILFFCMILLYLLLIVKSVENTCLKKKIPVSSLTEGDWVLDKVPLKNSSKYIYTKTGITAQGIKMLKKTGKKMVLVKEGIPFVPSFLLAYIVTIVVGNWILVF